MDSSFIPPPFPFPEAWPKLFAEPQRHQEKKWLTPATTIFSPVQCQIPATAAYDHSLDQAMPSDVTTCSSNAHQDIDGEHVEDDAYEYGYIMSNEWREHFQSSVALQRQVKSKKEKEKKKEQPQKKKKKIKTQRQAIDTEATGAFSASRSSPLQREAQAAKIREFARKWKRQGNVDAVPTTPATPQVEALETS